MKTILLIALALVSFSASPVTAAQKPRGGECCGSAACCPGPCCE